MNIQDIDLLKRVRAIVPSRYSEDAYQHTPDWHTMRLFDEFIRLMESRRVSQVQYRLSIGYSDNTPLLVLLFDKPDEIAEVVKCHSQHPKFAFYNVYKNVTTQEYCEKNNLA